MENQENLPKEKKRLYYALFFPCIIVLFMALAFLLEKGMGWHFAEFGIEPRNFKSLPNILFTPFIHAGISHLLNNTIAFFILSVCLYYFYSTFANKILILSVILSGAILWLIGRDSYHIGASGVVFALSFFLFFSGVIRKHVPLIAIALIVVFLYGNNVWHLFPWKPDDPISWEGHLAGGITGTLLAIYYRKDGPQKIEKVWEEDEPEEENEFWKINEDETKIEK